MQTQSNVPNTSFPSIKIVSYEFHPDGSSEYRILVGQRTKYISFAAGAVPNESLVNFSFSRIRTAALPPLPSGDWNHGTITKCPITDNPVWTTKLDDWPGVTALWHDVTIDASEFTSVMFVRRNLEVVTCSRYPGLNLVFKFATFPHRIPEINHETMIYKAINEAPVEGEREHEGSWYAPPFLGHVTFEGKVVGFVMDFQMNRPPDAPVDFTKCKQALEEFHRLGRIGMTHGAIKKEHFVMTPTVSSSVPPVMKALLIDYSKAKPAELGWELGEEVRQLRIAFDVANERDFAPANAIEDMEERGETAGQTRRGPGRGLHHSDNGNASRERRSPRGSPRQDARTVTRRRGVHRQSGARVGGPSVISPVDGEWHPVEEDRSFVWDDNAINGQLGESLGYQRR